MDNGIETREEIPTDENPEEVNQDQYLWQRIKPQWRITLVRQPQLKAARMQLKKKLLMQEVT